MSNPDFLTNFNNMLGKLQKLNSQVTQSVRERNNWSSNVKQKLITVNQQIKQIMQNIQRLNQQINGHQEEINRNAAGINSKDSEIQQLKQQLNMLEQQKQQADARAAQIESAAQQEMTKIRAELEENNSRLGALQQELNGSQQEIQKLNALIQENGTQAEQQKAAALLQQEEKHKQILEQQQQQVIQQIKQKEEEQLRQQQEANAQLEQLRQQSQEAAQGRQEVNTRMNELLQEIESLKATNDQLKDRIVYATQIIYQTIDAISNLEMDPEGDQEAISRLVEDSLMQLSSSMQGNIPSNTSINKIQPFWNNMNLNQIMNALRQKAQNPSIARDPNNKYNRTLEKINELLSRPDVTLDDIRNQALGLIEFKNGNIMGGKTRKTTIKRRRNGRRYRTKKMKGGFQYNAHAKRRGITTFSRRSSSSRNNSSIGRRRSSRKNSII